MKVHEAAKALGVTPRALRFYEEKGLVSPGKMHPNGYRDYEEKDMENLRWIIALRELGMPVAAIGELMQNRQDEVRFMRRLDQARSTLYSDLLRGMEELALLEQSIQAWRHERKPILGEVEKASKRLRQVRTLRHTWNDIWNYDELARRYGNEAPLVAHEGLLRHDQYHDLLRRTLEWIDPRPGEKGLDLGAGSGNLTLLLHQSGALVTAIEQSEEMLALLAGKLPLVDARAGNLLTLPLSANTYSFAVCTFALQHLNHPQQQLALAEMDRVLISGGRLAIAGLFSSENADEHRNDMPKSPESHDEALTPSFRSELEKWLQTKGYSIIFESIEVGIGLLYGIKDASNQDEQA